MTDLAEPAVRRQPIDIATGGLRARLPAITPSTAIGLAVLAFWVACAIIGPSLVPFDPYAEDFLAMMAPPDAVHWFGTDQLGRDVFSRVVVGARDILLVAPLATLAGVGAGSIIGLVLGTLGGMADAIGARLLDSVMALPFIVLVTMALVAIGPSNVTVILVIAIAYAPLVARTVRTAAREQRERDYVDAARLAGEGPLAIMFLEILPNVRETILIELVTRLGYAFFSIATLSFLGLGIQPPTPEWGLMISDGRQSLFDAWWIATFPGLAIIYTGVTFALIGEGLDTALRPKG